MNYFVALYLIIQINLARITNNDPECEVFKSKIGAAKVDGNNSTQLEVGGVVSFQSGTANLEIQLHYNDEQYFSDPKYKGLTKEDGIDNELTCLDLKLLKFLDNTFNEATQEEITDLTPVASFDKTLKRRYLTYIIPGNQLNTKLVISNDTANLKLTGYYAIAYYIDNDMQFIYYFSFSVIRNKTSNDTVADTEFLQITNTETLGCQFEKLCTVTLQNSVEFCTDSTCLQTNPSQEIHLRDEVWLMQKVTTPGLRQYYLSDTKIRYVSDGLDKHGIIEAANYTIAGQAIYTIIVPLAWGNVLIKVDSSLKIIDSSNEHLAATLTLSIHGYRKTLFLTLTTSTSSNPNSNQTNPKTEEASFDPDGKINPDSDGEIKINFQCSTLAKMLLQIGLALISFLF